MIPKLSVLGGGGRGLNIFVKYRINKIENIFLEPIIAFKYSYVNIQTLKNKNFIIKILNETLNYNSILKKLKGFAAYP